MGLDNFLWQTFIDTGDIEVYLLYKSTTKGKYSEEDEIKWHLSEQEVS